MPNYNNQYLTLVAKESGQFQFYLIRNSKYYYSTDEGQTWNTATSATTISVSNGSRVMYKGTLIPNSSNYEGIGRFSATANFEAEGNVMSLLYGDNFIGQTSLSGKDYVFNQLFLWGNLTSIQNLKLPATTLSIGCYYSMFARCTSLTTIPEDLLLATTLTSNCYGYMFNGCSYLQSIPSNLLPATTLESGCYYNMFQGCTSLTTAPELPATTLAVSCYNSMFYGCTSLTTAPSLPATTLESGCYGYMFQGCTSLTTVPVLSATTLANYCYQSMFRDCTSLTSIPSGLLPATTLAIQCYTYMFSGCTNLTTAPVLSATTLADRCYYGMFQGCSSLSNITCLATDISATQCTNGWVDGVSNSGTFYKASGMTDWTRSTSGIPINWTVEDYNPQPIEPIYKWERITPVSGDPTTFICDDCGSPTPIQYRWVVYSGSYSCSGTTKMTQEKKQVSTDSGLTWNDVSPLETRAALPVIEYDSEDCGYVPPTPSSYTSQYFTIIANSSGVIVYKMLGSIFSGASYYYSTDEGQTWTSANSGTTISVSNGDRVMFKGTLKQGGYNSVGRFSTSVQFELEGNIMSLIYGDDFADKTSLAGKHYIFCNLFSGCTNLTSIKNLKLPATRLSNYCYDSMFIECASLATVPSDLLPTTTFVNGDNAGCYRSMFRGCSSLRIAPILPVERLTEYECYANMFRDCSSLCEVTCLATEMTSSRPLGSWLDGVASNGTLKKANTVNESFWEGNIPSNWSIEDYYSQYRWVVVSNSYECSGTTKMTKEKKQISYDNGETWVDSNPLVTRPTLPVIEYNSTDCGYVPPSPSGHCKYYIEQLYVSYDSGSTWSATTTTRKGDLFEINSKDCGYVPPLQYRWVSTSGEECSGTTKMSREKEQVSTDGGETWTDVSPAQYRAALPVIEYNSSDCGYRSRITTYDECKGYDKYRITETQYSEDYGHTWIPISSAETLIQINASSCGYVDPCRPLDKEYEINTLDSIVYLLDEFHSENITIDADNDAFIGELNATNPLKLNVKDLSLEEESIFDGGRYKFSKTVKFKIKGFADKDALLNKNYIVIQDKNGVQWLVNVDFPSVMTYSFNLSSERCETEFTFKTVSEYPTLRFAYGATPIVGEATQCEVYYKNGIDTLKLIDKNSCSLNRANGSLYISSMSRLKDVDYLEKTCQLQEVYDGENITTTLQFNLPFKDSFWYILLQFADNKYSSIVTDKNGTTYFSGFNFGLEPKYNISAKETNGETSYVTVTMTEISRLGSITASTYTEEDVPITTWEYVKSASSYSQTWECYGDGTAKYLIKEERYQDGGLTGRYMALNGYASQFPNLNIVGTFNETVTFNEPSCAVVTCVIGGTVPTDMTFTASSQSQSYTISASCDWNVTNKPSWLTMSRTSGDANTEYTVNFFNTREPQTLGIRGEVVISTGSVTKTIGVIVEQPQPLVWPSPQYFDCLHRYVYFNFDPNCKPTVTQISAGPLFEFVGNQLKVYVPRNSSTSVRRSFLKLEACGREMDAEIFQDKTYEEWKDVSGIICENGTSWSKQQRYTGTTSTTIDVPTDEYRKGTKIMDDDPACA